MVTNKNDFLSKELVKTLSYTTASQDREAYSNVVINGRKYFKTGTLQAVTVVCNIYKLYNTNSGMTEYWAHMGLSKQHPTDIMVDKNLGYEVAYENAINNRDIIRSYIEDMDLEYIKTPEEINIVV